MAKERDTTKYHLKSGGKIVHRGITDRPLKEREQEHQKDFPGSRIVKVGRQTTRDRAKAWERRGGKRPT
ncbi:hypothetical protein ES703_03775 [subsurface metagenome]